MVYMLKKNMGSRWTINTN